MKKISISYIILLLIIAVIALFVYMPFSFAEFFNISFSPNNHKILEIIVTLLIFLIFFRSNNIYSQTKDKRYAIIAAGFLAAALLNIFHLLVNNIFPYDVLSIENLKRQPTLFFLEIKYEIIAITYFLAVFYTVKTKEMLAKNFRQKCYLAYLGVLVLAIFLYIFAIFPTLLTEDAAKLLMFESSIGIVDDALLFITALIFADMRITSKKGSFPPFTIGLIILGIGQLFFINPNLQPLREIIAHILRILGFLFVLIGLPDLLEITVISLRQKLLAYSSFLLIFAYLILVSLSSAIFGIRFPSYSPFFFIEFLLISAIIQNIIIGDFIQPITSVIDTMGRYKVGEEPAKIPISSTDEIGHMTGKFNEIARANWNYLQEINQAKEREGVLRQLILRSITTLDVEEALRTVVVETGMLFEAVRCYFIRYNKDTQEFLPVMDYESYVSSIEHKPVTGIKPTKKHLESFIKILIGQMQPLSVNDVSKVNLTDEARDFFEEYAIKSFMAVPVVFRNNPLGVLVVDFDNTEREFTQNDINTLTSIATQSAIVLYQTQLFNEVKAAKDREETLRKIISIIRSSLDINSIFQTISEELIKLFKVERVFFVRFPNINNLKDWSVESDYLSSSNMIPYKDVSLDPQAGEYWGNIVFSKGITLAIDDVDKTNIPESLRYNFNVLGITATTAVPIMQGDDIWGTLSVATSSPRNWSNDEINILETTADQIYTSLKQAELYSTTKQSAERESLLRKLISTVRGTLDVNETFKVLSEEIAELFKAERIIILNYPDPANFNIWNLVYDYINSPNILQSEQVELKPEAGIYWGDFILNRGQILTINDTSRVNIPEPLKYNLDILGIRALIAIPIRKGEIIWGTLAVCMSTPREWVKEEIELLQPISDQIFLAINQSELYTRLQKVAERENLLRSVSEIIRSSLDINETLNLVCEETAKLFNLDRVVVIEFPDKNNYMKWVERKEYLRSNQIKSFRSVNFDTRIEGFWGKKVLESSSSLTIKNIQASDFPDYLKNAYKELGINSIVFVPIEQKQDKWGILGLANISEREWVKEDIELVKAIAGQIYIAIRQAELFSITEESRRRENFLRTINNEILTSNTLDEAINNICREIGTLFDIDRVAIRMYDSFNRNFSEVKCEHRKSDSICSAKSVESYPEELNEYLIKELWGERKIVPINDIDDEQYPEVLRNVFKKLKVKSTLMAPIIYKNNLMAVLFLTNTETGANWQENDIKIVESLIQQIALGINQFQTNERLYKTLNSERTIKDIVLEARKLDDYTKIFDFLLDKVTEIFGVDRALNLRFTSEGNLSIRNEVIKNIDQKYSIGQDISNVENTKEILPDEAGKLVIINDIDSDIKNPYLKEYFRSKKTYSLLLYPVTVSNVSREQIEGIIMLCSSASKKWTVDEINSFKLIVDTTTLVYFELKQRQDSEDQRKTFLATLTHDLRSPLNAEQKALEAILAKKLGTTLDSFSEYLEDIYKTNEELLRIVNNILSVYHYEEGKYELKISDVYISELIETSANSMSPLARDQDFEINTHIEENIPCVRADRDEIFRVLTNLISNAIKHNTRGTTINVSAKRVENGVQVSVQDNGKGIPEAERSNIFQRYPTTKRKIGTGLGLYLSKQIIDAHHGKIWFETEEGKGTTFYFILPELCSFS